MILKEKGRCVINNSFIDNSNLNVLILEVTLKEGVIMKNDLLKVDFNQYLTVIDCIRIQVNVMGERYSLTADICELENIGMKLSGLYGREVVVFPKPKMLFSL